MLGPFPGMDPYLEDPAFWSDFHASFITYCRDALSDSLPDNYEARIDERVSLVEFSAAKLKRFEPDLAITHDEFAGSSATRASGAATLQPVTIPLLIEEETRQTYIEILHRPNRSLVAVLELLSPANKEEPGRSSYLAKRDALLHQPVHLIELDLLLTGRRVLLLKPLPRGDYYALIAKADQRPDCQVYSWTLQQALPVLPIPLKPPDPEVGLDLAAVFATAYERGRYARAIDYAKPPPVGMNSATSDWLKETTSKYVQKK